MKKPFFAMTLFVSLAWFCQTAFAIDTIRYATSYQAALEEARSDGKPLLVYTTADWCAPCLRLEKEVFVVDSVASFFNEHFINYKLDVETAEGKQFLRDVQVAGVPSFVFLDGHEQVRFHFGGFHNPHNLIAKSKEVLYPETSRLLNLSNRYESGERSAAFLNEYLSVMDEYHHGNPSQVYLELLAYSTEEALFSEELWTHIQRYLASDTSKDYRFVQEHQAKLAERYGEQPVMALLARPYIMGMEEAAINLDEKALDMHIARYRALNLQHGMEKTIFEMKQLYLMRSGKFAEYIHLIESPESAKFFESDADRFGAASVQLVLNHVDDRATLLHARQWLANLQDQSKQMPPYLIYLLYGQLSQALHDFNNARLHYEKAMEAYAKQFPDSEPPNGILSLIDRLDKSERK